MYVPTREAFQKDKQNIRSVYYSVIYRAAVRPVFLFGRHLEILTIFQVDDETTLIRATGHVVVVSRKSVRHVTHTMWTGGRQRFRGLVRGLEMFRRKSAISPCIRAVRPFLAERDRNSVGGHSIKCRRFGI